MYKIYAYYSPNDTVPKTVFDPSIGKMISEGKLTLKENEIDDLTLTVNQNNILYGKVKPMNTHIEVYDDDELIFRGRALKPTRKMEESGQFVQTFVFESISAYLLDSIQRFKEVHNTSVAGFFNQIIHQHNTRVPTSRRFNVRKVNVTNSTDNVYRYIDYVSSWDTIKDKLLSRLGGYLRVEHVDGSNYIDYLVDPGVKHPKTQPIQIAINMKSASVEIDPTDVVTRLIPLGKTLEDENATSAAFPRLTIQSVNNGKDWLDIPDLQAQFGVQEQAVTWDDVSTPERLLANGKQWIASQSAAIEHWQVNVLELPVFDKLKVSDSYWFVNDDVATPQFLRISEKTIDFLNPYASTISISDKPVSLSQYQWENNNAAKRINDLRSRVEAQTNTIGNISSGQSSSNQKITNLQNSVAGVNAELQTANLGQMKLDISALNNSNQQQQQTNNDFESRIAALEGGSNSGGD